MKSTQKIASLVAGIGTMAMLASPGAAAVTPATPALPLTLDIDPAMARAAAAPVALTPAPVAKVQASGVDPGNVKCLVKFFEPDLLKAHSAEHWYKFDRETVVFLQAKLICNDTVGTSEILIEQNDQLVVAGTVVNNQTNVSLHSLTVKLNDEQEDTFCIAIARQTGTGTPAGYTVIEQECFNDLGGFDKHYGGGWDSDSGGGDSKGGNSK